MKTFLTTIQQYLSQDFIPVTHEVRFITYQQILDARKAKVKRLLFEASKERNHEQFYKAKHLLTKIENTRFTIT